MHTHVNVCGMYGHVCEFVCVYKPVSNMELSSDPKNVVMKFLFIYKPVSEG